MSLLHRGSRALAVLAVVAGMTTAAVGGATAHAATAASQSPARTAAAVSQQAAVGSSGNIIYVDNSTTDGHGSNCSDTASDAGGEAQPFCTIGAAASAAQPGDTVTVEPGTYGATAISVSGTSSAPITFQGATTGVATVDSSSGTDSAFTISDAHYVEITGFNTKAADGVPSFEINGASSNVTVNDGKDMGDGTAPTVQIDSASNVTLSRMSMYEGGVLVNAGVTGTVITGDVFAVGGWGTSNPPIDVTDAPGTDVTGNTIDGSCRTAISLAGASSGSSVQNNVITEFQQQTQNNVCWTNNMGPAVVVSTASTVGTTADYNFFDAGATGYIYEWAGTDYNYPGSNYANPADFTTDTGQGAHDYYYDIGSSDGQYTDVTIPGHGESLRPPYVGGGAANGNAPGELPTDLTYSPRVASSGSTDYFDRGAVEYNAGISQGVPSVTPSGPMTATATPPAPTLTTAGETSNATPTTSIVYDFGDGTIPVVTTDNSSVQHTFATAGAHTITITQTYMNSNGFLAQPTSTTTTKQVDVGADYTSVTPTRVMDTRNGTGVAKGAVAGNGTVTLPVSAMPGVPSDATAVVLNLTETGATGSGYITAYPGDGTAPTASNINYTKGTTIPNQVTIPVSNGEISFKNGSGGTVQLVADLAGYYGASGDGYAPQAPTRVLDTRNGTGAAKGAVPANSKIQLNLSGKVPSDATAVTLNVTETAPQSSGWLAVYPDSSTTPTTSSLNFTSGQTGANLVTVPLNNGIADFYNGSGGTVQVVADLEGYYGASATDTYVPYGPTRIIDTRSSGNSPVAADGTLAVATDADTGATPVAAVDNITATKPTSSGYLTAYPDGTTRPGSSTLNFNPGATVQNLSVTQASPKIDIYNGSGGTVQVIVDEDGYFIANQ